MNTTDVVRKKGFSRFAMDSVAAGNVEFFGGHGKQTPQSLSFELNNFNPMFWWQM